MTAWYVGVCLGLYNVTDTIYAFYRMALSTPSAGESVRFLSDRAQRS